MNEIKANLWDIHKDGWNAICCTCNYIVKTNGELVMGAGIAKQFKDKYPWLAKKWGDKVAKHWHEDYDPQILITLMKQQPHLIYVQTKRHFKDQSDLQLIYDSVELLCLMVYTLGWKKVLLPRPGCTNGGLNWENEVKPKLAPLLDRWTQIYVIHQE
jgi:hypothetical protein